MLAIISLITQTVNTTAKGRSLAFTPNNYTVKVIYTFTTTREVIYNSNNPLL